MKRVIWLIPFCIFLGGCTHDMNKEEIDSINMALVLGIDYKDEEYRICALYSSGGGESTGAGEGPGKEEIVKGKGKTAYEALEDLKLNDKKNLTLAQTGIFLIGEGAAKKGIEQSIDFLKRDETIKMEALIYIIKGEEAQKFIKKAMDKKQIIHENLDAMKQKQLKFVTRNENTIVNILNEMEQKNTSLLIPYLITKDGGFLIEGYAVFDQLKLYDYLDHETSDGVNFLRNIIRTFPIYLKEGVDLSVTYTKTRMKTEIDDQLITVTIKVDFETAFKEIIADTNAFTMSELNRLTAKQEEYILEVLKKPVDYSIKNGLDILRLARLVENQNVSKWNDIRDNWSNMISEVRYEYQIRSKITKSFILGYRTDHILKDL